MKILIVHAHPEPSSFNAALTQAASTALWDAGHEVVVSDLYADDFDPAAGRHDFIGPADASRLHYQTEQAHAVSTDGFSPELTREQARVLDADLLILQFPLWWGQPPGILKGWFDRVLAYGVAYVDGRRFTSGLMRGRRALMSVTTGGPPQRFSDDDVYGTIDRVLWPVRRLTLEYMGYEVEEPFVSYAAPRVGEAEREAYLAAWRDRVLSVVAKPVYPIRIDRKALLQDMGAAAWQRKV